MSHFTLQSSPADLVVQLTENPVSFAALLTVLYDRRYDGQVLIDLRRGRPRSVAFPRLDRVPLVVDAEPQA